MGLDTGAFRRCYPHAPSLGVAINFRDIPACPADILFRSYLRGWKRGASNDYYGRLEMSYDESMSTYDRLGRLLFRETGDDVHIPRLRR